MKIGILQAGLVPDGFAETHGEYDVAFERLLRRADPEIEVEGWRVVDGEIPPDPTTADGWLISGSKHGVYEDHTWMEPLKAFVRACVEARSPLIGVCFGHQVMAEALGGRAEKFAGGWRLGPQDYRLSVAAPGMEPAERSLRLHAVHQDQVTAPPPDATTLATGEQCAHAALAYGPLDNPYAISIQPHPEFTDAYARELIEIRRGAAFPVAESDAALAALDEASAAGPDWADADWAARWFVAFLKAAARKK